MIPATIAGAPPPVCGMSSMSGVGVDDAVFVGAAVFVGELVGDWDPVGEVVACVGDCDPVGEVVACVGDCDPVGEVVACVGDCDPVGDVVLVDGPVRVGEIDVDGVLGDAVVVGVRERDGVGLGPLVVSLGSLSLGLSVGPTLTPPSGPRPLISAAAKPTPRTRTATTNSGTAARRTRRSPHPWLTARRCYATPRARRRRRDARATSLRRAR